MQQLGSLRHQCIALLDVRGAVVIHTRRIKERARQSKPKHHEGCRPQIITRGSQTADFVIDVVKGACWALSQFASDSLEVRRVNPTKLPSRLALHDGSAARLIIGSARDLSRRSRAHGREASEARTLSHPERSIRENETFSTPAISFS